MDMMKKLTAPLLADTELLHLVAQALSTSDVPAISAYDLGKLVYLRGTLNSNKVPKRTFEATINALTSIRLLEPINSSTAFILFGHRLVTPSEIYCCIDPFAYISHLSAMEHHGLTDRFPKILYITRPLATEWRKQADLRMQKDLGDDFEHYKSSGMPRLTRPNLDRIKDTTIHIQERSQFGAFRIVSGSALKVATIGRVFLDMLREPKLCGGIQHVIDIFRNEAKRNFRLILDEIERHGQPIDKVRAGYVLTEVCGLEHPLITQWQAFAQRGGSRKLNPDAEFSANFSETWKLSINVPSLTTNSSAYDDY